VGAEDPIQAVPSLWLRSQVSGKSGARAWEWLSLASRLPVGRTPAYRNVILPCMSDAVASDPVVQECRRALALSRPRTSSPPEGLQRPMGRGQSSGRSAASVPPSTVITDPQKKPASDERR